MEENMDFWWENEERASCWEYWYLTGMDEFNPKKPKKGGPLEQEWQEELDRRLQSSKLSKEEWHILEGMRQKRDMERATQEERELGVKWTCKACGAIYRVKTPFFNLYCSECLSELKSKRFLDVDKEKLDYWMLEE